MLDNVKFHGIDLYYDEDCDDYVQYVFTVNKDAITEMNQLLTENGWPGNLDNSFDLFCQTQQEEILSQLKADSLAKLQPVLCYYHNTEGTAPHFQFGFINPKHMEYGVVTSSQDNIIFIPGHEAAFEGEEDWEAKDVPVEQLLEKAERNNPYYHWFSVPLAFENAIEDKIQEKTGLNAVQLGTLVFADVGEV